MTEDHNRIAHNHVEGSRNKAFIDTSRCWQLTMSSSVWIVYIHQGIMTSLLTTHALMWVTVTMCTSMKQIIQSGGARRAGWLNTNVLFEQDVAASNRSGSACMVHRLCTERPAQGRSARYSSLCICVVPPGELAPSIQSHPVPQIAFLFLNDIHCHFFYIYTVTRHMYVTALSSHNLLSLSFM